MGNVREVWLRKWLSVKEIASGQCVMANSKTRNSTLLFWEWRRGQETTEPRMIRSLLVQGTLCHYLFHSCLIVIFNWVLRSRIIEGMLRNKTYTIVNFEVSVIIKLSVIEIFNHLVPSRWLWNPICSDLEEKNRTSAYFSFFSLDHALNKLKYKNQAAKRNWLNIFEH